MTRDLPNPGTFYAHLDACRQCRENPFSLCPQGLAALKASVGASDQDQPRTPGRRKP